MSFCSFADGAAMFDATPIENMFLLEHVPNAPDSALRVYLYARMLALHPELGGDMADMAKALRMDEEAVYDAFAYWEHQGLARRLTDRPPTYELLSARAQAVEGVSAMDRGYYAYRDFNNDLQALFGKNLMHPQEFSTANDWLNILGFEQPAVLRMVAYGISKSRSKSPQPASVFRRLDKLAAEWADRGVRTLEDVERAIADEEGVTQAAREVLKQFGLRRQPSLPELESVRRWVKEWGFTQAQILEACGETTKSRTPTFAYLDAILRARHEGADDGREGLVAVLRELDPGAGQPTPDQLARYRALLAEGFPPETVRLAAVQCHRKRKYKFEDLEWMLGEWRQAGVQSPEAAEAYVVRMRGYADGMRRVLEKMGRDRGPSQADVAWYQGWRDSMDAAVIEYAAECANGKRDPKQYMDKLLGEWRQAGVGSVEAAMAERAATHEARGEQARAKAQAAGSGARQNPALDYEQREYRDEDFGEGFFEDLSKYVEGDKA